MPVAREDITKVASSLGELREEVVFLGGSALFLLVTDPVVLPTIRPTEDVDVIIEVGSTLNDDAAKIFISNTIIALLSDEFIHEALPGYLPGDDASQARARVITERMKRLASA